MKSIVRIIERRIYSKPQIDLIKLDNEISLVLESSFPDGEPTFSHDAEYFKNDPFKNLLG
jgi:hypothetical protein